MVHLTYVENPFETCIFERIIDFYEEKSFYDCINRKFISEPFKNLQYTFHMYLLTGDSNDWIGYVLFSNENKVNFIRNTAIQFLKDKIFTLLNEEYFINKVKLNEYIDLLTQSIMKPNLFEIITNILKEIKIYMREEEYQNLIKEYELLMEKSLTDFLNYYNLDIVICLEKNAKLTLREENKDSICSENELVEKKYYGFIQETFKLVEQEIIDRFSNSYIVLKNDDYVEVEIEPQNLSLEKKIG